VPAIQPPNHQTTQPPFLKDGDTSWASAASYWPVGKGRGLAS
jgi:hypothetical protein